MNTPHLSVREPQSSRACVRGGGSSPHSNEMGFRCVFLNFGCDPFRSPSRAGGQDEECPRSVRASRRPPAPGGATPPPPPPGTAPTKASGRAAARKPRCRRRRGERTRSRAPLAGAPPCLWLPPRRGHTSYGRSSGARSPGVDPAGRWHAARRRAGHGPRCSARLTYRHPDSRTRLSPPPTHPPLPQLAPAASPFRGQPAPTRSAILGCPRAGGRGSGKVAPGRRRSGAPLPTYLELQTPRALRLPLLNAARLCARSGAGGRCPRAPAAPSVRDRASPGSRSPVPASAGAPRGGSVGGLWDGRAGSLLQPGPALRPAGEGTEGKWRRGGMSGAGRARTRAGRGRERAFPSRADWEAH